MTNHPRETGVIQASSTPAANFRLLRVARSELVLSLCISRYVMQVPQRKGTYTNTPRLRLLSRHTAAHTQIRSQ